MSPKRDKPTGDAQPVALRNPLHDHPLLRKGGAHDKSRKAKRRAEKVELTRQTDD